MGEQSGRPIASEVVDRELDSVGGREAHRTILAPSPTSPVVGVSSVAGTDARVRRPRRQSSGGGVYAPPIDPSAPSDTDRDEVLAANERFYAAFEGRDLDAMSSVWEHDQRVVCTHPGWSTLRGWGAVAASWFALFQGPVPIQFILTDVHVAMAGNLAWVSLDENVIGEQLGTTVAALNLFVRAPDGWLMVAHHGSAVA
jgi:ketosteroid isomerase-like protein